MPSAIDGLNPPFVWKYFAAFSRIPRCSKHEAAASQFIVDSATRLGLPVTQDRFGNVAVKKPASAGREKAAIVCLQGHLDMVCEKSPTTVHDFSKDPIELVRRDNTLMAKGTTLGADNRIAVATNLAIMEDGSLEHGPLEFLFTVDEETGLTGAHNLQPGFIESRVLLNLDSEEEGALYVGCAGGKDTIGTWAVEYESARPASVALAPLEVTVSGLRGGHSGLDIDKGRGNALKILARVLRALGDAGARLSRLEGGNKRNAIPREAHALVYVPDVASAEQIVGRLNATARAELATVEPELLVTASRPSAHDGQVLVEQHQKQITQALGALPHGVVKMSADISSLVETSTNLAVVTTEGRTVSIATSQRSSVASEIDAIVGTVSTIFELAGARVEHTDGYPGWKPNLSSPILKTAIAAFKVLYHREPEVKAVHAGLECGIIGEKFPGIDMMSFGPTLEGVHSPDEKIHVDTVPRFWEFLLAVLKAAQPVGR
jgi:dipeptidase D